ncbi:MAG TPA: hypothetical protein VGS10_06430 [Terracidiphilus sp.]|nr:hypothetical protein [Terracidiphilus sp.]
MVLDVIPASGKSLSSLLLSCVLIVLAAVSAADAAPGGSSPLSESQILRLLKEKLPAGELVSRIHQDKISFAVTKPVIEQLKTSGAIQPVLEAVRDAQPVGLVWSRPSQFTLSQEAFVEVTPMVVDGGHDYLACTDDERHVSLLTNAGGAWKAYPVAPDLSVGNNVGARVLGLAVHQGVAYVAMVPNLSGNMQLMLAYNPGGNPAGPWLRASIYSTDSTQLQNPSLAVAGDQLLIAFDNFSAPKRSSNDVYLGKIPLADLSGNGKAPSASVMDLSTADDAPGGPSDTRAQLVADQGQVSAVWTKARKTIVFSQAQLSSGLDSLRQTQELNTVSDPTDKSLVLVASGNTELVARFADDSDPNNAPGCCVVLATSNTGGSWSTSPVGRTNLALEAPGLAISECGPSMAYMKAVSSNGERLAIATLSGGQWHSVELSEDSANQPRIAATDKGLDLVYLSAVGQIGVRSATCYLPPAPLN